MSSAEDKFVSELAADAALPIRAREGGTVARSSSTFARVVRWIALLCVGLLVLQTVASILVRRPSVRQRLDARMAAAFGRPVEVDNYSFSLWGGPTLGASGVRVEEDPRFGYEYFLRADSLAVHLRWTSLLRGRVELGTLSLTGATLNVDENATGDWNLAEWLGHPAMADTQRPPRAERVAFVPRFRRVQLDGGRVNFKHGNEKLAFAFVDVTGTIESDGGERWRIDLDASPWRAAAILQQAGTIHLAGHIGGTSSALRPADLQASWKDASVSDFLRLLRGDDKGIRGTLAMSLNAQAESNAWQLEGSAQLAGLHRWDLAERPDNPAVNVHAKMALNVAASELRVTEATIEAPHSNAQAQATFAWASATAGAEPAWRNGARSPGALRADASRTNVMQMTKPRGVTSTSAAAASPGAVEITSAAIDVNDALAWLRAFRAAIPDGLAVRGNVSGHGDMAAAWPPRVIDAILSSAGTEITGGQVGSAIHLGATQVGFVNDALSISPMTITIGGVQESTSSASAARMQGRRPASSVPQASTEPTGTFHLEVISSAAARAHNRMAAPAGLHLSGSTEDASSLVWAASGLGWQATSGFELTGPLHCDLRWPTEAAAGQKAARNGGNVREYLASILWPWQTRPIGTISLGGPGEDGAKLRAPFLNLPVESIQARVEWKLGARHVTITSAQAFGTNWAGTLDRGDADAQWAFSLSAGNLNSADFDRWLNPRWRESFIDRMLPFLNAENGPNAAGAAESLRANGQISADEFTVAPLHLTRVEGALKIDGRHLVLSGATGDLDGGRVSGDLDAQLDSVPAYSVRSSFSGVDLAARPADDDATGPERPFAGTASGDVAFWMQGASREDLFGSLRCTGALDVRDATWRGVSLGESLASEELVDGSSTYRDAAGQFTCGNQAIALKDVVLAGREETIQGSGTIDFSRNLSLELRRVPSSLRIGAAPSTKGAAPTVLVTGTLAAPEFKAALAARRTR